MRERSQKSGVRSQNKGRRKRTETERQDIMKLINGDEQGKKQ
jgi:hypothetical protein